MRGRQGLCAGISSCFTFAMFLGNEEDCAVGVMQRSGFHFAVTVDFSILLEKLERCSKFVVEQFKPSASGLVT